VRSRSLNQRWVFGPVDHVKIGVKIPYNQNKERTFKTKTKHNTTPYNQLLTPYILLGAKHSSSSNVRMKTQNLRSAYNLVVTTNEQDLRLDNDWRPFRLGFAKSCSYACKKLRLCAVQGLVEFRLDFRCQELLCFEVWIFNGVKLIFKLLKLSPLIQPSSSSRTRQINREQLRFFLAEKSSPSSSLFLLLYYLYPTCTLSVASTVAYQHMLCEVWIFESFKWNFKLRAP